jgi:Spy/CpxP family protein refolding chaperone
MTTRFFTRSLLLAALIAAPALAQPAPPQNPSAPPMAGAQHGGGMGSRMFPSMSEAGRAAIHEAMMAGGDRRESRARVAAAREKIMAAVAADRFDAGAVKRAMDEERALSDASHQQRQAAMIAAFQKLSPEDRKAFAADSRAMKERMGKRMDGWRERLRERRNSGSMGGEPARPDGDMMKF